VDSGLNYRLIIALRKPCFGRRSMTRKDCWKEIGIDLKIRKLMLWSWTNTWANIGNDGRARASVLARRGVCASCDKVIESAKETLSIIEREGGKPQY